MRVLFSFGQFNYIEEVPDSKIGQPLYQIHPLGKLNLTDHNPDHWIPKKMEFHYRTQLARDLVEYFYVGESS